MGLTVWLARTLFHNGGVFLADVFEDREHLAEAVNRLLVTGFSMGNLGYAFLLLRANVAPPVAPQGATQPTPPLWDPQWQQPVAAPTRLTVLYDASCPLCVKGRDWLVQQAAYVPLDLVAAESAEAQARYPDVEQRGAELVVVGETGDVWIGPEAFLMCLWALRRWREWSYRLSGPSLAPMAERFFLAVSRNRGALSAGGARCPNAACSPSTPAEPVPPR